MSVGPRIPQAETEKAADTSGQKPVLQGRGSHVRYVCDHVLHFIGRSLRWVRGGGRGCPRSFNPVWEFLGVCSGPEEIEGGGDVE